LENAQIVEKVVRKTLTLRIDYEALNKVRYLLKCFDAEVVNQTFEVQCEIQCKIALSRFDDFCTQVQSLEKVQVVD
jgi:putative IMPACT (imprinted ancient) family translation regulator